MTKQEMNKRIGAVIIYYIIAVLIRYATTKTTLLDNVGSEYVKTLLHGIGPAIGAIFVFIVFAIKPKLTFSGYFKKSWLPLVIYWVLPVVVLSALQYVQSGQLSIAILVLLVYGLLEEIGWRGFLQPALSFLPKFAGILLITVMWFFWHLNVAFTIPYLIFFLVLLAGSWGIGVVAKKTNSLFAVSALHAAYDIFASTKNQTPAFTIALITIFTLWILTIVFYDRYKLGNKPVEEVRENKQMPTFEKGAL